MDCNYDDIVGDLEHSSLRKNKEIARLRDELAGERAKLAMVKDWVWRNKRGYFDSRIYASKSEMAALDNILSDTRAPLAVVGGVVTVEGRTTQYAVIKAPCDLPFDTRGAVVFMAEEWRAGNE